MQLVHVGFNNVVDMERVLAIADHLSAAPIKRLIERARNRGGGTLVDMTAGHEAKSAIITNDDRVILVPISSETIVGRLNNPWKETEAPEEHEEGPQYFGRAATSLVALN